MLAVVWWHCSDEAVLAPPPARHWW